MLKSAVVRDSSLALAPITGLHMILLDAAMPMHRKAKAHLSRSEHAHRFMLLQGDVHHMPLCQGTVHLAVSRGSIFFWEDQKRAFKEIHRVLHAAAEPTWGAASAMPVSVITSHEK